jgi:aryl-alcohol dehydrogenase-like predicted oxidoreductase
MSWKAAAPPGFERSLALAYCPEGPNVASVTFGAKNSEQVVENLGALEAAEELDADVLQRVRAVLQPKNAGRKA